MDAVRMIDVCGNHVSGNGVIMTARAGQTVAVPSGMEESPGFAGQGAR